MLFCRATHAAWPRTKCCAPRRLAACCRSRMWDWLRWWMQPLSRMTCWHGREPHPVLKCFPLPPSVSMAHPVPCALKRHLILKCLDLLSLGACPACRLQICAEHTPAACRFAYAAPEVLVQDPRGLSADIYRCAQPCGATLCTNGPTGKCSREACWCTCIWLRPMKPACTCSLLSCRLPRGGWQPC